MSPAVWIGGPPCAGKTTVASRLARRHGLRLYSADTRTWEHLDRALAAGNAGAHRWESMAPAERWRCDADELLEMSFLGERGRMVLDDLAALPEDPLVVAEGVALPASALAEGAVERSRAIWLVPTAPFQEARLAAAGVPEGQAALYRLLRDVKAREVSELGLPAATVDGSLGLDEMTDLVESHLGGTLRLGPGATTVAQRRDLVRESNRAVVGQVRGYYRRWWAEGDPEAVEREFACECGDPGCTEEVVVPVGEADRHRVLAPGHAG